MDKPSTPTQEEAMNAMFWGVYERTRSYGPPGGSVATLIARSKITDEQMKIVSREMPRLVGLDEKAAEEELRKLGVTLDFWVDPAAAKSKKATKRKSREVIEIPDSSSDDEDEKPSPTKKAKAAQAARDTALNGTAYTGRRPGYVYTTRNGVTGYYADAAAATAAAPAPAPTVDAPTPAADPEEDAELICRPRTTGNKS